MNHHSKHVVNVLKAIGFPTNDVMMLQKFYPEAYEALPEPYKADHCLTFKIEDSSLLATHDIHDESYVWLDDEWLNWRHL